MTPPFSHNPETTTRDGLKGRPISPPREQKLDDDYLCQVSGSVSCGACCGLYNVADDARPALEALLAARARRFADTPRTVEGILQFRRDIEQHENQQRPLSDFHHCPYLGLVGRRKATVGCMLHPLEPRNHGQDFRSLSHYGGMTCHIYFCPATRLLPSRYKQTVRSAVRDWYLYGLLVTEHRLLQALFEEIEYRLNRPVYLNDFRQHPQARKALEALLALRVSWPFRPAGRTRLVNYFFNDNRHPRPAITPPRGEQTIGRYRTILQELETRTHTAGDLRRAELHLDNQFRTLQECLPC